MSIEHFDNAKLHDEKENIPANTIGNHPFIDVARTYASRRDVVRGGVAAAAGFFAPTALAGSDSGSNAGGLGEGRGLVNFRPVPIEEGASDARMPHISRNYRYQTLIPWGTDLLDVDSENFNWEFFVLASSSRDTEGVFTGPDAAWADADGRLFIGTDGGQPDGLQDQLVVFDTTADGEPEAKRLFVGVASDEITGFATTPNCEFAFINIQHPGNGLAEATNFPARPDGITTPRDCTVVLRRVNGGVIGS